MKPALSEVELLDPPTGEVLLNRLHQDEIFARRHRYASLLQLLKEGCKHRSSGPVARRVEVNDECTLHPYNTT
jgi:hypothetical protein